MNNPTDCYDQTISMGVLLAVPDRQLLRHLSRFLGMIGYSTVEMADFSRAGDLLSDQPPPLWIIDGSGDLGAALELAAEATEAQRDAIEVLLLADGACPIEPRRLVEAGVADVLAKPIVYGELLARLRAAARAAQFGRRFSELSGIEPLTGMPNRVGLLDRLRNKARSQPPSQTLAIVMFDVDWLARLNRSLGRAAADDAIASLAERIAGMLGRGDTLAAFGKGTFCAVLDGRDEAAAVAWADKIRAAASKPVSLSAGVASGTLAEAETILQHAGEALRVAKISGRDCTLGYGETLDTRPSGVEAGLGGGLFEHTHAGDVMASCAALLTIRDTVGQASLMMRQTRLDYLVVADSDGRLIGLLSGQSLEGSADGRVFADQPVTTVMLADPPHVEEDATVASLVDLFSRSSAAAVVITRRGRPTGLVTPEMLASLGRPAAVPHFVPAIGELSGDLLLVPTGDV